MVLDGGVALLLTPGDTAERDAVVEREVFADLCRLAHDDAHAVVDEEAVADGRARVDLDAGKESAQVGDEAAQEAPLAHPERMRQPVEPDGVQAGVAEEDLGGAAGGGVAL